MQWDYIIIGAGSSGCALASELARSGRHKVLLLEAGGSDISPWIRIPATQAKAIKAHDWGYTNQPDPTRNGRTESWGRGKVLGGSSSINGMMYVRGAASDFDRWAALGNRGWSHADVLPLFREFEHSDQVGSTRGNQGPLYVTTVRHAHPTTEAFLRSAVASGMPLNPDYNGASQEGIGYAQLSQKNGFRCSAARAFLKPLLGRENLKLVIHAHVHRIEIEAGRATGVTYRHGEKIETVSGRQIIVSAGAINSPQLLMLSGIGEPDELKRHGIECKVHAREVGCSLRDHPLLNLTYRMRVPTNNLTGGLAQRLAIGFKFLFQRSGPVAYLFEAGAFLKSSAKVAEPDIQLHLVTVGFDKGQDGSIKLADYPAITLYVNKSHPRSQGRIRLASNNPHDAPLIECRLLEHPDDLNTLVDGVRLVRRIMSTSPIAELVDIETRPGPDLKDSIALQSYIRAHAEIAYHPIGTCRMGSDEQSVVTPELKVRGLENLWVADASIMPTLISGNTNAVCMMIGMKLGRHLNSLGR